MRLSDIEVGAEYVVGQASYARRRVRVLSIGHPDDHYRGGGRTGELIAGSPRMVHAQPLDKAPVWLYARELLEPWADYYERTTEQARQRAEAEQAQAQAVDRLSAAFERLGLDEWLRVTAPWRTTWTVQLDTILTHEVDALVRKLDALDEVEL